MIKTIEPYQIIDWKWYKRYIKSNSDGYDYGSTWYSNRAGLEVLNYHLIRGDMVNVELKDDCLFGKSDEIVVLQLVNPTLKIKILKSKRG